MDDNEPAQPGVQPLPPPGVSVRRRRPQRGTPGPPWYFLVTDHRFDPLWRTYRVPSRAPPVVVAPAGLQLLINGQPADTYPNWEERTVPAQQTFAAAFEEQQQTDDNNRSTFRQALVTGGIMVGLWGAILAGFFLGMRATR